MELIAKMFFTCENGSGNDLTGRGFAAETLEEVIEWGIKRNKRKRGVKYDGIYVIYFNDCRKMIKTECYYFRPNTSPIF